MNISVQEPEKVIHQIISRNELFPNNDDFPLLIYKQAFDVAAAIPEQLQNHLKDNQWLNSWVDGIYDYHHYHSNTHETLVIISGHCTVQMGGDAGSSYEVHAGDVIIIPAGVAHKRLSGSADFKCIGAYPEGIEPNMNYGKKEEHPEVDKSIHSIGLPAYDPIFGKKGLLFEYWQ